jgi:hypothetical protein
MDCMKPAGGVFLHLPAEYSRECTVPLLIVRRFSAMCCRGIQYLM